MSNELAINEKMITRRELSDRWGLSLKTLKRREADGTLHPVTLSTNVVRYRISEIIAIENEANLTNHGQTNGIDYKSEEKRHAEEMNREMVRDYINTDWLFAKSCGVQNGCGRGFGRFVAT